MVRRFGHLTALAVAFAIGCSGGSASDEAGKKEVSEAELVASWDKFIQEAKGREKLADEAYRARKSDPETGAALWQGKALHIEWGNTDIVRSDSLRSPVTGKVELRSTFHSHNLTMKNGPAALGGIRWTEYKYDLEFAPEEGGWKFVKGTIQRTDEKYPDKEPKAYTELGPELSVLFDQASDQLKRDIAEAKAKAAQRERDEAPFRQERARREQLAQKWARITAQRLDAAAESTHDLTLQLKQIETGELQTNFYRSQETKFYESELTLWRAFLRSATPQQIADAAREKNLPLE